MDQIKTIKRNIIIYVVGVLSLASAGGFITASGNDAGGLLFIASPLLLTLGLRFFAVQRQGRGATA